ncbi:hypothetical protein IWW45_005524 [Coemansia sp. RSA 485]|nr:hypothetical protein IWW45_005524 [Coemansia sp. RSA 485]
MFDDIDTEEPCPLELSDSDDDTGDMPNGGVASNKKLDADDDLYDQEADDLDAQWVAQNHPGNTDAVLSCPGCFTQICFVCQHHTKYEGQFRALSVEKCRVEESQLYTFGRKGLELAAKEKLEGSRLEQQNIYKLVVCAECDTKVGVMDHESVYHLFHVLSDV